MNDYNLKDYIGAFRRMSVSSKMFLKPRTDALNPYNLIGCVKYKLEEHIKEPNYFNPCGTMVFCGSQGQGKTLTAAAVYCHQLLDYYDKCILISNTHFKDRPFNAYVDYKTIPQKELKDSYELVKEERQKAFFDSQIAKITEDFYLIKYPEVTLEQYILLNLSSHPFDETNDFEEFCKERCYILRDVFTNEEITEDTIRAGIHKKVTVRYTGLNCLKYIQNGVLGVLYFIDEIHLELSSLERNIPVEVMVEISQQRKQRKHIVGTTQRYHLMNIRLREQVFDVVGCQCLFGVIQWNCLIDGETAHEEDGELKYEIKKRFLFFHSPDMYRYYDTYAKMKRYNNEWSGRPNLLFMESDMIAELIQQYARVA